MQNPVVVMNAKNRAFWDGYGGYSNDIYEAKIFSEDNAKIIFEDRLNNDMVRLVSIKIEIVTK